MKYAVKLFVLSTVLGLVASACGGASPLQSKPTEDPLGGAYVVKGGGGAIDAVKALTTAFGKIHPTIVWQGFDDVGSDAGVKLAIDGTVDLGYISRDLKTAEKGTVVTLPIGASGTGVGVNASSNVKALSKEQVRKIFSGEITDWKDVGGTPGKIRVLLREPDSATRSAFESYFFGSAKPVYSKEAIEVFQIDETQKAIASFKDAIGMMTINAATLTNTDIRLLTIDNVAATRENLANGAYPIRRPLYFVYNTDQTKLKPTIRAFIDWVKGPDGQKVLASL